MKNRFDAFDAEEKALMMIGLCKIRLLPEDPANTVLSKLLDEFTK